MDMTRESVVAACKANGGYEAPRLNDQLFLHCKGYINIQHLDEYTNAKVLWLEQNAITTLGGMEALQSLVSLFLQNNTIRSLRTFGAPLHGLRVLNVSHNYLSSLRGLAANCPQLETLQASHNCIASLAACRDLWQLSATLTSVDLSFNAIATVEPPPRQPTDAPADKDDEDEAEEQRGAADDEVRVVLPGDPEAAEREGGSAADAMPLVDFFRRLPLVSVIYLQGNAVTRTLKQYRRNMILHLPALTYLDERPVFAEERRVVEAWGRGGESAEAAERAAIREEKRAHLNSCVRVLSERMEGSRETRDRLTRRWEERQAAELEARAAARRELRRLCERLESEEDTARGAVERAEEDARADIGDWHEAATAALRPREAANRHAYEQRRAVEEVTREAERELREEAEAAAREQKVPEKEQSAADGAAAASLGELLKTDDDILREMEAEIDTMLGGLGGKDGAARRLPAASRHADPSSDSVAAAPPPMTTRAERAAHDAVTRTSDRLRQKRRSADAAAREDLWRRFEQWEKGTACKK